MRHLTSIKGFSKHDMLSVFKLAHEQRQSHLYGKVEKTLSGKTVMTVFFQPSTRTRLSFQSAALSLGAELLDFGALSATRTGDFFQESLQDTVDVLSCYADTLIVRSQVPSFAQEVSQCASISIINAGDSEHPTQALSDLWLIHEAMEGQIENQTVGLVGPLGCRVLSSMLQGLVQFKPKKLMFLLPPGDALSEKTQSMLRTKQIPWECCSDICELLDTCDVVEMHPLRLPGNKIEETPERFRLNCKKYMSVGRKPQILHPGPRLEEMSSDLDQIPEVRYFDQVKFGFYMRMALFRYLAEPVALYKTEKEEEAL